MSIIPKFIRRMIALALISEIEELDAEDLETFKALVAAKIIDVFRI